MILLTINTIVLAPVIWHGVLNSEGGNLKCKHFKQYLILKFLDYIYIHLYIHKGWLDKPVFPVNQLLYVYPLSNWSEEVDSLQSNMQIDCIELGSSPIIKGKLVPLQNLYKLFLL